MTATLIMKPEVKEMKGLVHCPLCTRTVEAQIVLTGRRPRVKPAQKCPRCSSSLDAGYVVHYENAA